QAGLSAYSNPRLRMGWTAPSPCGAVLVEWAQTSTGTLLGRCLGSVHADGNASINAVTPVLGDGVSAHLHFHRNRQTFFTLFRGQVIQPLESDNSPFAIFDQHDIVVRFLIEMLFFRIVEPHAQGVPCAIVIDLQLGHSWFPFLMFFVK